MRTTMLAILVLAHLTRPALAVTRIDADAVAQAAELKAIELLRSQLATPDPFLLDPATAARWKRTFDVDRAQVTAEVIEVVPNAFGKPHQGGFTGQVRFTTTAHVGSATATRTSTRRIQALDLTPPAHTHTLFIHGTGTEHLRAGSFTLRNFPLSDGLDAAIRAHAERALPGSGHGSAADCVDRVCREISLTERVDKPATFARIKRLAATPGLAKTDQAIKNLVDDRILTFNPRTWGRVRTNGQLNVCPPLWAPDDVINYTPDGSPLLMTGLEMGYPGCDNRLSDPYMSVYTFFEGYIYKTFRRHDGTTVKEMAPQRYTINTRMNYVHLYPDRAPVPNLDRLAAAPSLAARILPDGAVLEGTPEKPLELEGIWYAAGRVTIGGHYRGRGLIVSAKSLDISRSIESSDPAARLGLVALGGPVQLLHDAAYTLRAYVYARDGLLGPRTASVRVTGNLACETLNRDRMPSTFACWFDPSFVAATTSPVGVWLLP